MEGFTIKADRFGRFLLPSKIRKQLGIHAGSELIGHLSKDHLVLKTREQALRQAQARFARLRPKGTLLSEEIIRERRTEA